MRVLRRVSAVVGVVVFTGVAAFILLVPKAVCACLTPEMEFQRTFGVSLRGADAEGLRAAVLARLPRGTPVTKAAATLEYLGSGDQSRGARACAPPTSTAIICHVLTETTPFAFRQSRVELAIVLEAGTVAEVEVRKRKRAFGSEREVGSAGPGGALSAPSTGGGASP